MKANFEEVGFSDNFMFGKIMENPSRAKAFLEQILKIKIHHIEYIEREKGVDEKYDGRSIRMDVYVDDGQTVYDCEMQTTDKKDLPKRSRYYQSLIDISLLRRNDNFRLLKKSFVIFVCTFDPFGDSHYIYSFENRCKEVPDLTLNDEAYKIFINTKGTVGDVSEEFKELLKFIDTSEDRVYGNSLANDLLSDLKLARSNKEWRKSYMTWKDYGNECREEGLEEGLKKGREEGLEKGREEVIINMLKNGNTPEEISKLCTFDLDYVKSVETKLLVIN